jgi:hypothetical protein
MKVLDERAVKLMCQQKRLYIWLKHYPRTQGVKNIKVVFHRRTCVNYGLLERLM